MNNMKKKILILITSIIIFLAVTILLMSIYLYIKKTKENKVMDKFIGHYELVSNSIKSFDENFVSSDELTIEKNNIVHSSSKIITSNYINVIDEDTILVYFGLLGDVNSPEEAEQNKFYFSKLCLEKTDDILKQVKCPTKVKKQEISEASENIGIKYQKTNK